MSDPDPQIASAGISATGTSAAGAASWTSAAGISADLEREAAALRASSALGRPGPLSRLFEFLLTRSSGAAPKELEIAIEVFGKRPDFDVAQDSLVRVYVHKLRRRLDEYYGRNARPGRIVIPKGEYRLSFEQTAAEAQPAPAAAQPLAPAAPAPRRWPAVALASLGALVIGALLMFAYLKTLGLSEAERDLRSLRASAVWGPLFDDDLPITIVVGDYFLLAETNDAGTVTRLVREFFVNSQADFIDHLELNPQWMQRYRNLNLTYLPAAAAFALHDLSPVLDADKRVRVMLMSDLDGATLRNTHVVYVGYISGLGMLGDPLFDASRLQVGGTYDELVDPATSKTYVARPPSTNDGGYTDYGYFATLRGPEGNRIVIIAGTRDMGVMQTAESLSRPSIVATIDAQSKGASSFESLTEVYGVGKASMNAKRLFVSEIEKDRIE